MFRPPSAPLTDPDLLHQRFADGSSAGESAGDSAFVQRLLTRKTVRSYTGAVPPEALLDLLTAGALCASAKSDFQQASILRVTDPQLREGIGALFPAMPWIAAAPAFFIFLGDARRLQRIGELRGKPVDNGTLEGFFNASIDAALALQTFVLAAEAAGLGCCPISVIRNRIDEVAPMLELPDLVFPVAGLCLGYPAAPGHVSLRLPRAMTVHRDRYADARLPEQLDQYDRTRHERHPLTTQRNTATFGVAAFYGWSEDKARQAAEPEGAAFPKYLRSHGFSLD
ncbi:MAG: NADPH-dependent oxidoreductase [Ramlibacter sp.]